jgi:hypothetical protein
MRTLQPVPPPKGNAFGRAWRHVPQFAGTLRLRAVVSLLGYKADYSCIAFGNERVRLKKVWGCRPESSRCRRRGNSRIFMVCFFSTGLGKFNEITRDNLLKTPKRKRPKALFLKNISRYFLRASLYLY